MYSVSLSTAALLIALRAWWLVPDVPSAVVESPVHKGAEGAFTCSSSFACPECKPQTVNVCTGHTCSWALLAGVWLTGVLSAHFFECFLRPLRRLRSSESYPVSVVAAPDLVGEEPSETTIVTLRQRPSGPLTPSLRRARVSARDVDGVAWELGRS